MEHVDSQLILSACPSPTALGTPVTRSPGIFIPPLTTHHVDTNIWTPLQNERLIISSLSPPHPIQRPLSPPLASKSLPCNSKRALSEMAASMATTTATASIVSKSFLLPSNDVTPKFSTSASLKFQYKPVGGARSTRARNLQVVAMSSPSPAKEGNLSEVVEESIKKATEVCAGDEKSGECAAAWDEVEEVSAAASDMRTKQKSSDPLENFCKDNPETDECRTYDN